MEELGHDSSHDDDGRLALRRKARCEVLANRVVADCGHGREEQQLAHVPVARLAHRCPRFPAGAGLEDPRRGSRVGGELAGVFQQPNVGQLGHEACRTLRPDAGDAEQELVVTVVFRVAGDGFPEFLFEFCDLLFHPGDVCLETLDDVFVGGDLEAVALAGDVLFKAVDVA